LASGGTPAFVAGWYNGGHFVLFAIATAPLVSNLFLFGKAPLVISAFSILLIVAAAFVLGRSLLRIHNILEKAFTHTFGGEDDSTTDEDVLRKEDRR
jgi:hypothetical protein